MSDNETTVAQPEKELDYMSIAGEGYTIIVPPEAEDLKLKLLEESASITIVDTPEQAEAARLTAKKLARLRIDVEAARKKVSAPITKKAKEINEIAANFIDAITNDETRVTKLIADHAHRIEEDRKAAEKRQRELERQAELQRQEAERKAREAEQARLRAEREAEEARRKALEKAEEERKKAEEAASAADEDDVDAQIAAAEATDRANAARRQAEIDAENSRKLAAEEAERIRKEQEAAAAAADRAEAEARQAALASRTQATSGVKFDYDYEIQDIGKIYGAYPGLCEITVKRKEMIAFIKSQAVANGAEPTIPGLKVVKKAVVSKR